MSAKHWWKKLSEMFENMIWPVGVVKHWFQTINDPTVMFWKLVHSYILVFGEIDSKRYFNSTIFLCV